jgi:hypothetical protein
MFNVGDVVERIPGNWESGGWGKARAQGVQFLTVTGPGWWSGSFCATPQIAGLAPDFTWSAENFQLVQPVKNIEEWL